MHNHSIFTSPLQIPMQTSIVPKLFPKNSFHYLKHLNNMSQEQPNRPQEQEKLDEPIKYGDVFNVHGDLARHAIAPGDAAMMQTAENRTFGHIQKGGPASTMQSAAIKNEKSGFVGHDQVSNDVGVEIIESEVDGRRVFSQLISGQVVAKDAERAPMVPPSTMKSRNATKVTIGEALEAAALTDGNRPVDYSDAAAIQAAEVRATGRINIVPGGVAAAAQSAATHNARVADDDEKTRLGEVLANAIAKLPSDKAVSRRDAEGVLGAELRNDPNLCTRPGGVGATLAAAARLNEKNREGDDKNQDK